MTENPIYQPPASEPLNPLFSEEEKEILEDVFNKMNYSQSIDGFLISSRQALCILIPKLKNLSVPRQTPDAGFGS